MTTQMKLGGAFTLPGTSMTVDRMGYGAMQLAGPQVWGPPRDRNAAVAVLREAVAAGLFSGLYFYFIELTRTTTPTPCPFVAWSCAFWGLTGVHYALAGSPIESRLAIVSGGSCSVAALRFSRRCSTEDVPGISRMLDARWRSHASATCMGVASSDVAAASSVEDCKGVNPPSGKNGT